MGRSRIVDNEVASLPLSAIPAAWAGLSREDKTKIGCLAIQAALLRFASGEFMGDLPGTGVVYLNEDARGEAETLAEAAAGDLSRALGSALPDLFGCDPSAEHPNGTDPKWALPIVRKLAEAPR